MSRKRIFWVGNRTEATEAGNRLLRATSRERGVRRHSRRSAPAAALVVLGLVVLAAPAVADEVGTGANDDGRAPAVSPGSSLATVLASNVEGLDSIGVTARAREGHVEGTTLGSPEVCVSAKTSEVTTESTGEGDVVVKLAREAFGCAEPVSDYRFDALGWEAHVRTSVPARLITYTYELRDEEWVWVDTNDTGIQLPPTVVDVTWTGSGEPQISPWISPIPYICYAPPFVCGVGAGAQATNQATVDGSVDVRAFDVTASFPADQAGTLAWWV